MYVLTFVKMLHLLGLVLGLGGAIFADTVIFKHSLFSPVDTNAVQTVRRLASVIFAGLAILWVTGIALVWINVQSNPNYLLNEKLWAKFIIVNMLTVNGLFIHSSVLPFLQDAIGRRLFDGVSNGDIATMTMIGSVSFVSWVLPLALGLATELNNVTPVENILAIYTLFILVAWLASFTLMSSLPKPQKRLHAKKTGIATKES